MKCYETDGNFDVIVSGGGIAGVAAAVASSRVGAKTLLIERFGCLGGAATMRNVVTFCGLYTAEEQPRRVVGGFADEILYALKSESALSEPMRHRGVFVVFEPEPLKFVLDNLVSCVGVTTLFGAFVCGARRTDNLLHSVDVASHGGMKTYCAKAFVDCTGDGDLAAFSGSGTRYGNRGTANLGSLGTRFSGIPHHVSVTHKEISDALAASGFGKGEITKRRSVVARLPISGDMVVYLASEDYDPRDSLSHSLAEFGGRRQAQNYLKAVRRIRGCENAYLALSGPEFGTRESRHLNCRHQLTWNEIESRKKFEDCIALGAWGAEWHDRQSFDSQFDYPPGKASYGIPFGCLHSIDTENLFCAGRLADADRKAGAAIRVMGTAMATGQAAGTAAALEAAGAWAIPTLRARLIDQGVILDDADVR